MFEIDRIPSALITSLQEKNIRAEDILLGAYCDRDREQQVAQTYLFATADALLVLSGMMMAESVFSPKKGKKPGVMRTWKENSFESYPIQELKGIRVEEQLSTGRLCAERGEEPLFLACFTNFCKESMFLFAKYANKIAKGEFGEIDQKDLPEQKKCPKCGMRYPDMNRRVCPQCMEKGKLFLRFSKFFARYRLELVILIIALSILTATSILAPYLSSGFFYDEVIYGTGSFAGELLLVLGLIVSTRILKMIATIISHRLTARVAIKMVFDLKKTIFGAIKRLSLGFFTGRQTGGLMTQVNQDAQTINFFFCDGVPYLIINVIQVVVLTVLLFLIEPFLAFVTLLTVPVFVFFIRWMFGRARRLHAKRYSATRQMNSFLSDVLTGMRVVKAFSREDAEVERFQGRNLHLAQSERKLVTFNSTTRPIAGMILATGNIVAWGVGGWMIITGRGTLTYGMLLTFIAYLNMVFSPLEFFVDFVEWTADCTNAMSRLFEIMDAQPEVAEKEDPIYPENLSGKVEFDHVSFSYQKGKKTIQDISFCVEDGQILGIVGHTGAGKSTIANLLMRLYDVEEGEIRVGGYPVRDLALSSLYNHIAIVSQETYLFMGSILDNIRYAKPEASFEEVIEAAKCAGAHEFIMKMPDAYHTQIGFGYQDLSGGERQRISIARAILKNPKILILDEATAAMDTGTERKIQDALSMLIKGKTTIMIAHRLSTLRDADHLIVIEKGKVAEAGTHSELLAREDGVYKKLFNLQLEALKNAGISE